MNRGLVYFHFDPHHQVRDYVLAALSSLRPHADHVLLVSNSPIGEADRVRLETCCDEILQRPNEGLDAGAYRAGLEHLGWERSKVGLPTGHAVRQANGTMIQTFEKGSISVAPNGKVTIR